jgi:threonine synthase
MTSTLSHLECSRCGTKHSCRQLQNLCSCGGPLLARYDLTAARRTLQPDKLSGRTRSLWRYAEVLPAVEESRVSLGEGGSPLLRLERLGEKLGLKHLYLKDESFNPTGTFKARGLAVAVAQARALGARALAVPTAGNAGGALAAYASRAGLPAHIFMPKDAPRANKLECEAYGARLTLVDGLISDCARLLAERKEQEGWFDVSTLKEPYRIEGKKTMGYELHEQLGGRLPDAVFYPTGGGVGLIGMWKAFEEMEALGWIGEERPKMVVIQASGCAPIVKAFAEGKNESKPWEKAETVAAGLRVPKALGDFLVLESLYRSKGAAVAVSDEEILASLRELACLEGVLACPEGAATVAALPRLVADGTLGPEDTIVLFNTGNGMKYLEVIEAALAGPGA